MSMINWKKKHLELALKCIAPHGAIEMYVIIIIIITLCDSEAVAQCIVIGPVCAFVCMWLCFHDNLKLRASILTKLGL